MKIKYVRSGAILTMQILGEKPAGGKGKTPIIPVQYISNDKDPCGVLVAAAEQAGFASVGSDIPESIAWRGSRTVLNASGTGGSVFTAEVKIVYSIEEVPEAPAPEGGLAEQA